MELTGGKFRIRGIVKPFVAGQKLQVRVIASAASKVKTRTREAAPGPNGTGVFQLSLASGRPGRIAVIALHKPTPQLERAAQPRRAPARARAERAARRARGGGAPAPARASSGCTTPSRCRGIYDPATQRAVMAWRKITGNARNYVASAVVIRGVLAGRGRFHVRHPDEGHHVEADLSKQVLALIDGGKVRRIYHTSSGKPSHPDRARALQDLPQGPGHERARDGRRELLRRRLRDPRLRRRARLQRQPRLPARSRSPTPRYVSNWLSIGDVVWVYP